MSVTPPARRRVLYVGDKGSDVLAYQRAVAKTLKDLGLASTNQRTGLYGQGTLADTLRLQRRLGLEVDGKVGPLTWTAVDPKLDLYGKALLTPKPKPTAAAGQRVAHEARVMATYSPRHYTQTRPYAKTLETWKARGGDCSGTSILCYSLAGCPDPNGTSFSGYGNTWSLIVRGVAVKEAQSAPGDLTFYGSGGPEHVVIELGGGMVMSHGHEGGPLILSRHYRSDYYQTRRYV